MFKRLILILLVLVLALSGLFPKGIHAGILKDDKLLNAEIDPQVYQLALKAHQTAVSRKELDNPDILTIIDYEKPSYEKRLWVICLRTKQVLFHTYVAHGVASGVHQPVDFSNIPGSKKSSLGVFKTGHSYLGGNGLSLNLHGLEKRFNSNVFLRRVVMHGASYVNEARAQSKRIGRSHGCPALSPHEVKPIIEQIKQGSLVFIYYPDKNWLTESSYV